MKIIHLFEASLLYRCSLCGAERKWAVEGITVERPDDFPYRPHICVKKMVGNPSQIGCLDPSPGYVHACSDGRFGFWKLVGFGAENNTTETK